jgi:DNA-binding LacI/PurR family transcriptional regulator
VQPVVFLSITDQVAAHLRAEILRGRWRGSMPGKHQLAVELGVNNKTVEAALRQLEKTGLLIPQGAGRTRRIRARRLAAARPLRIVLLLHERGDDRKVEHHIELLHGLREAGHLVGSAAQSLVDLRFDPGRVAALVRATKADAWIVCAGSRDVLEWFTRQPAPAFALFGQRAGLPIAAAGPDKPPAMTEATRCLLALGHRRVVLLSRKPRRRPTPAPSETAFLNALREKHIPVGDYNLPDWEETAAGFQRCLDSLFQVTPPTALIVDEASWFIAAMQFLLRRRIRVPQDVSLVCTDDSPAFACCEPPVACITWDSGPVIRRIIRWAANVSHGKADLRQTLTPSRFVPGGTIGPARRD